MQPEIFSSYNADNVHMSLRKVSEVIYIWKRGKVERHIKSSRQHKRKPKKHNKVAKKRSIQKTDAQKHHRWIRDILRKPRRLKSE